MIGCGINNRDGSDDEENENELENQLPSEHAYSITRLACVNNTQLLRLRNPYGNRMKWKGAWSDDSKEWDTVPEDMKRRMSLRRSSDGEFWMSYEDFVKRFNVIEVCNFSPGDAIEDSAQHDGKWHKITEKGEWIAGINSGGFKNVEINPQYLMTLESSNNDNEFSIVVTLMQNNEELAISFYIYHIEEEFLAHKPPMGKEFFEKSKREAKTKVSFAMDVHCSYKLLPGKYLIVPFNRKCESGEFLLRLFADKKCSLAPYGNGR
jgi:calpain, invertebrate